MKRRHFFLGLAGVTIGAVLPRLVKGAPMTAGNGGAILPPLPDTVAADGAAARNPFQGCIYHSKGDDGKWHLHFETDTADGRDI